MKRFHIIKKASPVNYALESSRTLDNGVVLKLIHCGETLTVSASYEKHLESFADPALRGGGGVYRGLSDPEVQRCGRR